MKFLNNMKTLVSKKMEKLPSKISSTTQKIRMLGTALSIAVLTGYTNVFAGEAETAWNSTMETVVPWVQKIGVVLVVFGGIEFAIANQSEDANQKTRATRMMVSGAIVIAVATAVGPLLYS